MTSAGAAELFNVNGFPLDDARLAKLLEYERLLLGWNVKINLVSRRETADLFVRQIVGSVSFLFGHTLAGGSALLDVGTGGGLPGLPLAIVQPDLRVTVIDSITKKITAVSDMVGKLGLQNVRTLRGRVEELDPGIAGRFDYIVARGVSSASEIINWCGPLLRVQGRRGERTGPVAGVGMDNGRESPTDRPVAGPKTAAAGIPIPPGSFILLKGGDLRAELEELSKKTGRANVTVSDLVVRGAEEAFTEKKVIVVTP